MKSSSVSLFHSQVLDLLFHFSKEPRFKESCYTRHSGVSEHGTKHKNIAMPHVEVLHGLLVPAKVRVTWSSYFNAVFDSR